MARKGGTRQKHIPQRTCIACRQIAGKRTLLRLVRTDAGVMVDPGGKLPGRGAYLHPDRNCWEIALRSRRLEQALRTSLSPEDRRSLAGYMDTLPAAVAEQHDGA